MSAGSSATSSRWAPVPVAVMDQLRFGAIDHEDTQRVVHGVVGGISSTATARAYRTSAARPTSTGVPGQPAGQRPSRSASCATRDLHSPTPPAPATRSCSSAPHGWRRHRRGVDPGVRHLHEGGPDQSAGPSRSATRSPRRSSSSADSSCSGRTWSRASRTSARGHLLRDERAREQRRRRHAHLARRRPAARPHAHGGGDPHVGEPGAHDGGRPPEKLDAFLAVVGKWEVETSVLGEVTGTGRLVIDWQGQEIVNVDPAHRRRRLAPSTTARSPTRPGSTPCRPTAPSRSSARRTGPALKAQFLQLLGSPNLASKNWVTNQYDTYVLGNTALSFPTTAA